MKTCTKCGECKPPEAFHRRKVSKDGLSYWCRACNSAWSAQNNKRPEVRASQKARRQTPEGKAAQRAAMLRYKYGISEDEFDTRCREQAGLCAVCLCEPDLLHVDHDHATGKVRGLLCGSCNRGIGLLQDAPALLVAAAQYLEAAA